MGNCRQWRGGKNRQGYGQRWFRGKNVLAHRAAYCEAHGLELEEIKGKVIRHTCDNPSCVNPKHLLPGTHQDNMDDMKSRGRAHGGKARERMFECRDLAIDIYQDALGRGKDRKTAVLITACKIGMSESHTRKILA